MIEAWSWPNVSTFTKGKKTDVENENETDISNIVTDIFWHYNFILDSWKYWVPWHTLEKAYTKLIIIDFFIIT